MPERLLSLWATLIVLSTVFFALGFFVAFVKSYFYL